MTWLYLLDCKDAYEKAKKPTSVPEHKAGFEEGWRAACRFLSASSESEKPVDALSKAGLELSMQYVNDDDGQTEKEIWNAAVKRCIEVLHGMQEQRSA